MTRHLPDIIPKIRRVVLFRGGGVFCDAPKDEALQPGPLGEVFGLPVEVLQRGGYYHVL